MADTARVAVLFSGRGSNLEALATAATASPHYDIVLALSDQPDAPGLARARRFDITTRTVVRSDTDTRDSHDARVHDALVATAPDIVVLAGYMRILGAAFATQWHGQMVNIHPSLLPDYRGLHTYRRALEDGQAWHGTSVHYVTETLDGGPVIAQARVAVEHDDTENTLRDRTQGAEHELYPKVVELMARGDLKLSNDGTISYRSRSLSAPLDLDRDLRRPGDGATGQRDNATVLRST